MGDKNGNAEQENKELETLKTQLDEERKNRIAIESKFSTVQTELEEIKKQGLKSTNDYKTLFEQESTAHQETKTKLKKTEDSFFFTTKADKAKAVAAKMGLLPEAFKYVEADASLDQMKVSIKDNGLIEVQGVDSWADNFKKLNPMLFKAPDAPNVNNGGGHNNPTENKDSISQEEFQKAFANRGKNPDAWKKAMAARKNMAVEARKVN